MIKDLKETKKQEQKGFIGPVTEAQKLLAYDETEDKRILRDAFPNGVPSRVLGQEEKLTEMEHYDALFGGDTYTEEQIKQVAIRYRLRFLRAKYYVGTVDGEFAPKIRAFSKEHKVEITAGALQNNFYILAPTEMFSLNKKKYVTKAELRAMADPAIFYNCGDGFYKMVHSWGEDLTVARFIEGWRWKNYRNHFLSNAAMLFVAFMILIGLVLTTYPIMSTSLSIVLSVLTAAAIGKTDEGHVIEEYFSEHNWNSIDKISE